MTQPNAITFSLKGTDISCFNLNDGKIEISVSGGQGAHYYSINNMSNFQPISSLNRNTIENRNDGTFQIYIKDDLNCIVGPKSVTIKRPTAIVLGSPIITNNDIINQSIGAITVNVSGGTGNFDFEWTSTDASFVGTNSATISSLRAATYTVVVKDKSNNSCFVTANYVVKEPSPLTVALSQTKLIECFGEETAEILAKVSGGFPIESKPSDFEYRWYRLDGSTSTLLNPTNIRLDRISGLKFGSYRVDIKDRKGVTTSKTINIGQPSQIKISLIDKTNVSCFKGTDGEIKISVKDGTPFDTSTGANAYTYVWTKVGDASFSSTDQNIQNLEAGEYYVEVTDKNICSITSPIFLITQPPKELKVTKADINDLTGFEKGDGSIIIEVDGGTTSDYKYEWRLKDQTDVISNDKNLVGVQAGFYQLTLTNEKCAILSELYEIKQPAKLEVSEIVQTGEIKCNGDESVDLLANVVGGVKPYTYSWIKEGETTELSSTEELLKRGAGDYIITVTDKNNNTAYKKITINEPPVLQILDTDIITTNISCFGEKQGTIKVTATGGVGDYSYSWSNGETGSELTGLAAGEYIVTVIDKNLVCKFEKKIVITQPEKSLNIKDYLITNTKKFGSSDGAISIEVEGGTLPYTYEWKDTSGTILTNTTANLTGIKAGDYSVTITDAKGCEINPKYIVDQPAKLELTITKKDISCFGEKGFATVSVTGGIKPYKYSWTEKGEITELSATTELLNRSGGTFVIKVTDANDIVIEEEVTIIEPPKLEILNSDVIVTNVSCFNGDDGTIKVKAIGGVGDYSYSWNNGASGDELTGLTAGEYIVTVIDKNLVCKFEKKIVVSQPTAELSIKDFTITDAKGFNLPSGAISIEVEGGTSPYTYEWTDASGTILTNTTANLTGVKAGEYTVKVIDAKGCYINPNPKYTINQPPLLEVRIDKNDIPCFGQKGSATAIVTGGVKPYTYSWTRKGEITELSNTLELLNRDKGTYVVKITDDNGIEIEEEVTIIEPPLLEILDTNIIVTNVSCFGEDDATIKVTATGGVGEYVYNWSNGSTESELTGLRAGEYTVKVTDKNLVCAFEKKIIVTQPLAALSIKDYTVTDASGFDLSNGAISIEVQGGTLPYTYEWTDASGTILTNTTANLTGVKAGDYAVKVIDAKECELKPNPTYTINQPAKLEVRIDKSDIPCFGQKGSAIANVTGGVEPYVYSWKEKGETLELSTTSELLNISGGVYVVEIEDKNGNKVVQEVTIIEPPLLEILDANVIVTNVSCFGEDDATIKVTATGGVGEYIYNWSNGSTGNELTGLKAGEYIVKVTDKNLVCEFEKKITITEPSAALSIKDYAITDVSGFNLSNGAISIEVQGGTSPYTYEWTDASGAILTNTTANLTGVKAGVYTVKVNDAKGCEISPNYTINQPEKLEVKIDKNDISCFGQKGSAIANVTGGVEPYTYSWIEKGETLELSSAPELLNISGGVYVIKVEDKNGNKIEDEVTIIEPSLLEITNVKTTDVTCYKGSDGRIEITVVGGVTPYSYKWAHTSTNANILENIEADTYNVIVTDANGCSVEREIIINQPEEYAIDKIKLARPTSDTVNDGDIEVIIVGGEAPYKYVWEDESGSTILDESTNLKTSKIENLSEGRYTITITDAKNCVLSETYNLANPGELLVSIEQTQDIFCYGESNAILDVITIGGAGGNRFQWFNAITNSVIGSDKELKNIPAGSYYVIVSNAEGIEEKSSIFTVTQPEKVEVSISQVNASCFEATNASFKVDVTGGTGT